MSDRDDAIVELEDVVARWSEESFSIDDETLAAVLGAVDQTWISLGEAEEAAGVSRSTLRAWYRSGRIPSRLVPGPHGLQRLVPRDAVVDQAARSPRSGARTEKSAPAAGEQQPHAPLPAADEFRASVPPTSRRNRRPESPTATPAASDVVRLAELAVAEARERAEAAEARAEAAEAALRAALERAAAAEAEARVLHDLRDESRS